jgi:endonuclease YncB( thermonuclease family)
MLMHSSMWLFALSTGLPAHGFCRVYEQWHSSHEEGGTMRTAQIPAVNTPTLVWQTLAALATAGVLLAIPTPVAAETKKESHTLHPVSEAVRGLMFPSRIVETPRLAPPARDRKQAARLEPTGKQLSSLPKQRVQTTRREAALARQLMLARLPRPDRPQKPFLLKDGQIRLIDGDTFAVNSERFRIRGINAPETTEAGGFDATQRLDLLLHEGPVLVIPYGQDSYGRTLAEVYVNNRNVADVMKEEGHDKKR